VPAKFCIAKFEAPFNLFLSFFFSYTSDIDRIRRQDLFFAQRKNQPLSSSFLKTHYIDQIRCLPNFASQNLKHRFDQYLKFSSAVLSNI